MLTQLRSCVIDSKLALAVVLATQIVNSILSEWGTDVKCIRECNHRGRSVVFEAVAMSTTFSAGVSFCSVGPLLLFRQACVMKVIPRVLPRISPRNCGNSPPEQILQTDSASELVSIILLKLGQKTNKIERQIDQLHLITLVSREKVLLGSNIATLSVPFKGNPYLKVLFHQSATVSLRFVSIRQVN